MCSKIPDRMVRDFLSGGCNTERRAAEIAVPEAGLEDRRQEGRYPDE